MRSEMTGGVETWRPPYPMSWVDHLVRWVRRMPLPSWLYYAALFAVGHVLVAVARVDGGTTLSDALRTPPPVFLIWVVYLLAMTHYLNHMARERMAQFRPALDADDDTFGELAYRLTTIPAGPTLLSGLVWLVVAAVMVGLSWDTVVALGYPTWEIVLTVLTYFLGGAIVYHTIHQLREVRRLYARVPRIDLYHLAPLNAFAALTAQTSLGWLLLLYLTAMLIPPEIVASGFGVTVAVAIGVAVAAFVVPLLGMHRRLEAAKREAIAQTSARLRRVMDDLHAHIDQGELDKLDPFNKASSALHAELEALGRTSTWPWATTTLRGFISALLLPMLLRVAQEVMARVMGPGR